MRYRKLGGSGISVSEIGFGAWGIGGGAYGPVNDDESMRTLRLAFEKGVNFIDTADLYGSGHSEELIGETFRKDRDKIVISTKGGTLPHDTFVMPQDFSPKHVSKALEASLKRLKTDYVDLYLLHSPRIEDLRENEGLFSALEKFKKEGKIKLYGISARSPSDAMTAIDEFGFRLVEANFNIIDHRALEIGLFDKARELGVGLIARTPLAFGYLSGKLRGDESFASGDHRSNWPKEQLRRWASAPNYFSFLFDGGKRSPVQAALLFCLYFDAISAVIPGMMCEGHVIENCSASGLAPLEEEEIKRIMEVYTVCQTEFYDTSFKKVKSGASS